MAADGPNKKLRKPYTITKTRDKWAEEEHERFLDALLVFGRDWKKVEECVGTKTVIQIRSHAQKYFLKAQKNGIMANFPPPRPKRKAAYTYAPKPFGNDEIPLQASVICPSASTCFIPESASDGKSMLMDYTFNETMPSMDCLFGTRAASLTKIYNSNISWTGNSSNSWPDYEVSKHGNPHSLHSVIPNMAEAFRFIGAMVDPDIKHPMGVYLRKLKEMDPSTVKIVLPSQGRRLPACFSKGLVVKHIGSCLLLVLLMERNLTNNLSAPGFGLLSPFVKQRTLSTYDADTSTFMATTQPASYAKHIQDMN